jgi:hypothetical protein
VSEDVWSERDTNPDAIEAALREMLRERHAANQALAPARVLNLVVVVDRSWKGEIANRLERVGRYHASRTILCAVEEGRDTLDAVAVMSYEDSPGGGIGVMRETVEIDVGPDHLPGLETIVDPIVVSELPTVLWCPHGHDDAVCALRGITDVMLLDSDDMPDADEGLARAQDELQSAYVVDLAWLRTTPWRERLAASFDPPARRPSLATIEGFTIRHQVSSTASALLALHRHPPRDGRAGGAGTRRNHRDRRGLRALARPGRGRAPRPGGDRGTRRAQLARAGSVPRRGWDPGGGGPAGIAARPHLWAGARRCQGIQRACRLR